VANYAIVGAATPADGAFLASVGLHNASTQGSVHVSVDISGYFI
jgi:pyridoxal biosynthesis lyase PdxS